VTPSTSQRDREQAVKAVIAEVEAKTRETVTLVGHGAPPDGFHHLLREHSDEKLGWRVLTFLSAH